MTKQKRKQKILLWFLVLLLIEFGEHAGAQPMPAPQNPFRNLPGNAEGGGENPFVSGGEDVPPPAPYEPPPPPDLNYGGDAGYQPPEPFTPPDPQGYSGGGGAGATNGGGTRPGDQLILGPKRQQNHAKNQEVVENFDYPNAEILDVAKAISKLTGRNFIYNPQDVKGRISIVSETPIKVDDAWKAFLTALDMRGFTIIPSGEYLRIERSQVAKEKQVPLYAGRYTPDSDEYITRVVPLRYISAKEVENTFRLWIPRQGRMYAHEQTNTLIITDTAAHIKSFLELISLLDVSGFQEALAVIPIRFAAAKDLSKLIEQILFGATGGSRKSTAVGGFQPPRPAGSMGATQGRDGSLSISQIIADERTNSLVVKANKPGLDEIRVLVRKLDVRRANSEGSGRIHVVRLQFADAEELSKALGSIAKTPTGGSGNTRPGGFPGSNVSAGPMDTVASLFQGEVKISPDTATQSLVITASPADFQTIKRVIEQLDIPRDQVMVEAIIMELNVSNSNGFGVSMVNPRNGISFMSDNLKSFITGDIKNGLNLGFKHGASVDIPVPGTTNKISVSSLQGLIELIQSTGNSTIVARPQLIALDNQEAEVIISDEIPLPNASVTSTGVTSQTFQKDKASLVLKVKPHINKASDFVRLEIEQKLEEFNATITPQEARGKALGKQTRETKTQVVVQNEDTVVLSGLIREKEQENINKVPLLGDIPVLGWLFKNSKVEKTKTDLIVFITPRIIKQYERIRQVLAERLKDRQDFVNDNLGGDDPQASEVRKLRARLPDLSKLNPLPSVSATNDSASFNAPTRSNDDEGGPTGYMDYPGELPPPPPPMDIPPPPPPPAFGDGAGGGDYDTGGERF